MYQSLAEKSKYSGLFVPIEEISFAIGIKIVETNMKFIDLNAQYQLLKKEVNQKIQEVLNHGQYMMGPEIAELENALAKFIGVKHAIGVSSGTDALLIAMMALGVQPGDEIITTPFSFIATAETIVLLGAKPVFVDIDPSTYNIDPALIEKAITQKTKAIMPVSLYGQCAEIHAINAIAAGYKLPVIEDAAQSFGATYHGKKSCSLTTIGCTSFFPSKPLGCYGDGGACFTNDDELAQKMRWILNHGQDKRYHHALIGINGRLDTLQAAVLLAKFKVFPNEIEQRQQVAAWYDEIFKDRLVTPYIEPYNASVWAQYTIQVGNREAVQKKLQEHGIPTAVHYPIPLYAQPVFSHVPVDKNNFAVTEKISKRVMSLPFGPYMKKEEVKKIAKMIIEMI